MGSQNFTSKMQIRKIGNHDVLQRKVREKMDLACLHHIRTHQYVNMMRSNKRPPTQGARWWCQHCKKNQKLTVDEFDWCCFYYFVRNSLIALLEALCVRIFSWDSRISVFFWHFFACLFVLCVCARCLTKLFFCPSQPGSCAWLSPFLLCADCTCVLLCVCLCMCLWKWVAKVINIWQIWAKPWRRHVQFWHKIWNENPNQTNVAALGTVICNIEIADPRTHRIKKGCVFIMKTIQA